MGGVLGVRRKAEKRRFFSSRPTRPACLPAELLPAEGNIEKKNDAKNTSMLCSLGVGRRGDCR